MFACVHVLAPPTPTASLLDCAGEFAPGAEVVTPETVVFSVGGLGLLYGGMPEIARAIDERLRQAGLEAQLAIARNPDTSIILARAVRGLTIVEGDPAPALSPLSIAALPVAPETVDILHKWGIRTCGELAALPEAGLVGRLGAQGLKLRQLARGAVERPLVLAPHPADYDRRVELDDAIELLEPLLFVLGRCLGDLCAALQTGGVAAGELVLALDLENGSEHRRSLRLPFPIRQQRLLLKLLQLDLELEPPPSPVVAVALRVKPAAPRTMQGGLYEPQTPEPVKLDLTLARIRRLVGTENLGVPRLLDSHRPEPYLLEGHALPSVEPLSQQRRKRAGSGAVRPRALLAFRYFRPPLRARVEFRENYPRRVEAEGVRGRVTACAGPWASSGHWWTTGGWEREEWDIDLNQRGLYRIYRAGEDWFIEGVYD